MCKIYEPKHFFTRPYMHLWLSILFLTASNSCFSQADSSSPKLINLSAYGDVYYAYYVDKPYKVKPDAYLYNFGVNRRVSSNLILLKASLNNNRFRASAAVQAGTYAIANYPQEPTWLKHIAEANFGIALNNKNSLWLDAGIFPSHIGFESSIAIDNQTLTRSLLAENSPYYLSGAKITHNVNEKFTACFLVLNGWQNIQIYKESKMPSIGIQLNFNNKNGLVLNWSTFGGPKRPDETDDIIFFNNFYGQFQLNKSFGLTAGLDAGISNSLSYWYSPVIIMQYKLSENFRTALRTEYFSDEYGAVVTSVGNGFKAGGVSLNFDWFPYSNFALRVEGRWLRSPDNAFENNVNRRNNIFMVGALSLKI